MSTAKFIVESPDAPPTGNLPYSQAIRSGNLVFFAGQIPLVGNTGKFVEGDVKAQTKQVFENMKHVLAAAGLNFSHVVKTTVFLADMADYTAVNEVYAEHFTAPYPARSAVQVAALPRGARVEIEAIAAI